MRDSLITFPRNYSLLSRKSIHLRSDYGAHDATPQQFIKKDGLIFILETAQ